MRYREYGRTGEKVSVLGFGGMRFDPDDEPTAIRALHRAVELGINYFDTAPGYCRDMSETFFGKAFGPLPPEKRDSIHISTKSMIRQDPTADDVRRRIEGQLKKLKRDHIDFYNVWCILDIGQYRAVMAPGGPYEGLVKARDEGLIRHISCSTHASGAEIAEIVEDGAFEGYTLGYNIINHRHRKEGLKAAAAAGRAVVTMNPLGGGMLTRSEEKLSFLKEDESDSFVAAALRFNLSHPEITIVLSGMKNAGEVEANVATVNSVEEPDPEVVERIIGKYDALGEKFCTGCKYCLPECPEGIQIHQVMNISNLLRMEVTEEADRLFDMYSKKDDVFFKGKRPWDCTGCGACEAVCTQKLEVSRLIADVAERFKDRR